MESLIMIQVSKIYIIQGDFRIFFACISGCSMQIYILSFNQ